MIDIDNKANCCGCGACVSACPQNALVMEPDEDGFLYPFLNELCCLHCDNCSRVCTYQKKEPRGSIKETYAAITVGVDRSRSASGGAFAGLAKTILEEGGVVFGSSLSFHRDKIKISHVLIDGIEELGKLQGSKYVQSEIGDSYAKAKERLKQGQIVLFSGTPCQIAGLYGYLGKEYENLFTVDLVCHGVPSEQMFLDYIRSEESKAGGKIIDFQFRDKSQGWKLYGSRTIRKNSGELQIKYFEPEESSFYQLFLNGYTYRKNCYSCPYAGGNRMGDLTLGDFWGIEIVQPELLQENGGPLDEKTGISCLIANNEKGKKLLQMSSDIIVFSSTYEKAQRYNGQLREPSRLKPERETVLRLYRSGYENIEKWYRRRLIKIRAFRGIRKAVPVPVKKAIKNVLKR